VEEKDKEAMGVIEYKRGIGLAPEEYESNLKKANEEREREKTLTCRSCGSTGHYNKANFMCPLNKRNILNKQNYENSLVAAGVESQADTSHFGDAEIDDDNVSATKDYDRSPEWEPPEDIPRKIMAVDTEKCLSDASGGKDFFVPREDANTVPVLVPKNNCTPLEDVYCMPVHQYNDGSMYGTAAAKATVDPAVGFESEVYVEDTEDDDVPVLELKRKLAAMCLLSEIEDE